MTKVDPEFTARLKGASLVTAEVLYRMPDHPSLVQTFIWQTTDVAPAFPRIRSFLDYWREEIQAAISAVRLAQTRLVGPAEWRMVDGEFRLH